MPTELRLDAFCDLLKLLIRTPSVVGAEWPFFRLLDRELVERGAKVTAYQGLLVAQGTDPRSAMFSAHVDRHGLVATGPGEFEYAAFIAAVATGSAEALADAAGRLADLGHQLVAAEAWARAAVAYRSEGDPRGSSAAMARATVLARRCEGAVTVDRLTTSLEGAVTPLSAREREIALLAAEGLGSQEIADRLVVSVRTVSNHLQNVSVKLGVNRRSDLRDALG